MGKVPASIHMSPEALLGGNIGKIRTGDLIRFDSITGELTALVDEQEWAARDIPTPDLSKTIMVSDVNCLQVSAVLPAAPKQVR